MKRMVAFVMCLFMAVMAFAGVNDSLKYLAVPNANYTMFFADEAFGKYLREAQTFIPKEMEKRKVADDQKAIVNEILGFLKQLDLRDAQFSLGFKDGMPVPSVSVAFKCGKPVDLDAIVAYIKKYDTENKLMCSGVQNGSMVTFAMGMAMMAKVGDGSILLLTTGQDYPVLQQNLANKTLPATMPGATTGMRTDGIFYCYYAKTAALEELWTKSSNQNPDLDNAKKIETANVSIAKVAGKITAAVNAQLATEEDAKQACDEAREKLKDVKEVIIKQNGTKASLFCSDCQAKSLQELADKKTAEKTGADDDSEGLEGVLKAFGKHCQTLK